MLQDAQMMRSGLRKENGMSDLYEWQQKWKVYQRVGSRVTCNPPPENTDEDWIVLDLDKSLANHLDESGWDYGGSMNSDDTFASYKKEYVNVICAFTRKEFDSFLLATALAKKLNVLPKSDRVALFDAIMYGKNTIVYELPDAVE